MCALSHTRNITNTLVRQLQPIRVVPRKTNIRISRVRGGRTEPILELLEPRLLLDGALAEQVIELFGATEAVFAENQGQWADESVRYAFDGDRANVLFTDSGPVFQIFRGASSAQFSAQFDGANSISPVALEQARTVFNYHIGDESTWRDGVAAYASVAYLDLYDGIDLHTWGRRDNLKYEFRVAPGADYSQISVSYSGIDALEIDQTGALHVSLSGGWGEVVDNAPYIYQIVDGVEVEVAGAYRLVDADTCTFEVTGDYDPASRLIIDPELDWSAYLGGSSGDRAYGIASDSGGNALVTGYTWSRGLGSGGWDTSLGGGGDAFAAKLSAAGEHLWSTYLGGSSSDYGYGIATDADDNVLVTGRTQSRGWVSGGWLSDFGGTSDGFVVKLNASGGHLWSSYLGGDSWDECHGIAADSGGNVLVTGSTESSGWVSDGWETSYSGGRDVFVVKLSASGEHLWSTYLGGSQDDRSYGIAADASGDALVTGYTHSSGWVSGGWLTNHQGGGGDVFVVRLSASGGHLWSTYLGGSSSDYGYGIAADADGNSLVTGYTRSDGWISGGWDTTYDGGDGDVFVVKLSVSGGHLWSTYLGGSSRDYGYGIAADADGNALVTGDTGSDGWISSGPDTSYDGSYDGFVVKLSASGGHLWSTYLGGDAADRGYGIAVDPNGNALVTGETESSGWVSGGGDTSHNGFADAFVAGLTGVVTISDPGLEQALRDALVKPTGYLTEDDMRSLTGLDASSRDITNLEGLQNCTNLTYLNLSGNQLSDLQALVDNSILNDGDTVDVTGNPLNSLAFVVHIPALEERGVTVDYFIPVGAAPNIVGRYIFYNNSALDSGDPIANVNDDDAIEPDKSPLLAGGMPGPANYTSYWRGINGIMVDFDGLFYAPAPGDFRVRVNGAPGPDTWSHGPAPTVSIRPGDGVDGSHRVTLIWADGAIVNQWVEVTVLSDANGGGLGLVDNSVFYFGNAVGDTDGDGRIGEGDYEAFFNQFGMSGDGLTADFDNDGNVDLADFAIVRASCGNIIAEPPVLTGDADQSGVVDNGDYAILIDQFGMNGRELIADFNGDRWVDLADFAILRSNFGNSLLAPAMEPEAPLAAVDVHPLDGSNRENASGDSITALASATAVDLLAMSLSNRLAESPSPDGYIPKYQPISVGSPATTLQHAATGEYDLRPLDDDPPTDSEADDLLADILTESPLTVPL